MANVDVIKELLDQTSEIKKMFSTEQYVMGSFYDFNEGKRKDSNMTLKTIYNKPEFLRWKEQLCFELKKITNDSFIDEIIDLLTGFSGFADESRFRKLESKLYVLEDKLDEYRACCEIQINDDERLPENEICNKMLRAISKLQRNHNYDKSSSEDTMNDYIRDLLDESYTIKDQTRQGESEKGKDAGEVDIQICHEGLPIVMIEGVKVSSLEKEKLNTHMNKVLTKYDPNGCPYTFLIVYTTAVDFDSAYQKIFEHFYEYEYPYQKETELLDVNTGYGELKHAQIILNRNGQKTRVHIWIAHIV